MHISAIRKLLNDIIRNNKNEVIDPKKTFKLFMEVVTYIKTLSIEEKSSLEVKEMCKSMERFYSDLCKKTETKYNQKDAEKDYLAGVELLEEGNFDDAINLLKKAVLFYETMAKHGATYLCFKKIGDCYLGLKRCDWANCYYVKASQYHKDAQIECLIAKTNKISVDPLSRF